MLFFKFEFNSALDAHTKEELEFIWKEPIAVQTAGNLKLPRFHLDNLKSSKFDQMTESGRHSFLRITLRFRRDFAYYMIQLYVPTCLIIIVSWFAFWLDATASPARTTLGVTTILATVTQTSGVSHALPPVSYTKVRPI
jgi:Neurotransmitter-gated ion-channel transmembrane region